VSANVDFRTGRFKTLDRIPETPTPLTEPDVQDAPTLTRLIVGLLRDVARILGGWRPRRIDFFNVALDDTGTTLFRLEHRFGGAVRFWVVDWDGADPPNVRKDATTTDKVLVVTSTSEGTATIRVEEAG